MSPIISSTINQGILVHFHFRFRFRFRFRFHPQFFRRYYSRYSGTDAMHHCDDVSDDPRLFLESVRERCKLGFSSADIPVSIFHRLDCLRPRPSIILFTQLFTAMSNIKPHPPFSTVVTFCHQLELSGLRPDCHSVGILSNCYCRLGRLDFASSLLGSRQDRGPLTALSSGIHLMLSSSLPYSTVLLCLINCTTRFNCWIKLSS
ncbi:hypothetical protein RND81_05G168000 [Saponaria officinalis]|uniref:Pentatricopeptide repeat-containing protein n=1 Tax=Saponaria officinalis TaxID=3572 RepID=A0AAW1KT12_SAPOF